MEENLQEKTNKLALELHRFLKTKKQTPLVSGMALAAVLDALFLHIPASEGHAILDTLKESFI